MAGFLTLDMEFHCRAVIPRFSGGGGGGWTLGIFKKSGPTEGLRESTHLLNMSDVVLSQF